MMRTQIALLLVALPLGAQQSLTLSDAVAQALAGHASLRARVARVEAAEGLRRQAAFSPNPRLYVQTENWRPGGRPPFVAARDTDDFLYAGRVFEIGGKRERRIAAAAAGVRSAELEREAQSLHIATAVALAYWNAAGAERVRDLLGRSLGTYDRIVQYHRDRVREGAAAEADLIRVQLEHDRVSVAAGNAAQEATRARIALFREMGAGADSGAALATKLDETGAFAPPELSVAVDGRPEVRLSRQAIERARANVRVQQSAAVPDPEVLFGYKRTAGLNTVIGGLQMTLPFGNRNQGQIASAQAELRATEADAAAIESAVRADIELALRDWRARREQITGAFRGLRERAEETARIAQAAYREGGADLLRLLDAERTRLEVEVLYSQTLADYQRSVIGVRSAMGLMP